ncbi:MAG: reverse transcriptase/maturase family protein [archaeon]
MKTYKNLFEKVCGYDNLYSAYLKARRGKTKLAEVLKFTYNLESELSNLQYELENQIYETREYRHFIIFEPKERKISALPFRDRIVHHAIYFVMEPIFEKKFIYDSYACRKRKGTHAGVKKLQKFIRGVNEDYYVLKCDVSKYFFSVNHEILKKVIRKKIADKRLLWLLDNIIDSVEKGIPIGNLTSQLFANIFLNELDEFVKYKLKIKCLYKCRSEVGGGTLCYIRYMDDFILLYESKQGLQELKEEIRLFLVSIRLTLHPKKANIFPVTLGIDFLGYRIFNNHRLIRKSTIKRFLKTVKIKIKKYDSGVMNFDKLMESFNSWEAYLAYGDSYKLKNSLYGRCFGNVM